ncbi:MAG: YihY/virulence factor BrkB family protein [candidate division Zixibacteria bacterium]|nr:YihY/virulence factor BrkB family protein [candidate division Zixibacteria bacterium]
MTKPKKARLKKIIKTFSWKNLKDWWHHYIGGLYHRVDEHHLFLFSGGLSFSLFVCIVPLMLVVFYLAGILSEKLYIAEEFNAFIDGAIPYEKYATYIKQMVHDRVEEFQAYKNFAGIIGLIGLFFASSGVFSSMRTILNTVYDIKTSQPVVIGKLRDFGLILVVLVYFLISTTLLPAVEIIKQFAKSQEFLKSFQTDWLENIVFQGLSFMVIFFSFFILYLLIPQKKLPRRIVIMSSLWAAILWESAKYLFGLYITHFASINRVYGAYALLVVVAFWIYYTSVVFIAGAEIGQLNWERNKKTKALQQIVASDQYL